MAAEEDFHGVADRTLAAALCSAKDQRHLGPPCRVLNRPGKPMQDVPESYRHYFPSWEEWAIAIGSLAGTLLIITFFARIYPIIPIHETIAENETGTKNQD